MSSLGWSIEEDSFEQNTVVGRVRFTNIIATLDPNAPRRMVIACHYDSKVTPQGFLGATDSAAPCAQMINLAKTLQSELNNLKGGTLVEEFSILGSKTCYINTSYLTDSYIIFGIHSYFQND